MRGDPSFRSIKRTRKLMGNERGESFSKNGYKNKHVSTTDESTPLKRLASEVIFKAVKDYKQGKNSNDLKAQRISDEAKAFLKDIESPWHRALDIKSGVFIDMIDKIDRDAKREQEELEDLPTWWKDTMPKRGEDNE